jgi:carbon monoxide dehydrogenase subunit G
MKIENEFRVNAPLDTAWEILTDIPTIAPCMPGAKLTSVEDDTYSGTVKIKVGPITAEYAGTAHFLAKDDAGHRAELSAKGRDSRGSGNAEAVIVAQLAADGDATLVNIDTDLKLSGKVAQFGRGVMVDVSTKLIGQFVECLEDKMQHMGDGATADDAADGADSHPDEPTDAADEVEALDLMEFAGGAVAKRLIPVVVAIIVAVVLYFVLR